MSPTTAEPNDLEHPDVQTENREEHHDAELRHPVEDRRSFFQKHPAAKPIVFLVAIVAVLLVGWFWWESRQWEDTDDAEIDGHIYPISARVSGYVVKVNFDDGQLVRKGDVLVVIDPTDYTVALEHARADYQDAQAQALAAQFGVPVSSVGSFSQIRSASADMSSAQAGVAAAEKQADAAKSQIVEAEADAKKLNTDVERYRQLLGKREISQQQFDAAIAAATAANATVQARQASLLAAEAQVKMAQSRIDQANAELKNAQATPNTVQATKAKAQSADAQALRSAAALDQAQLNLSYTTIAAPVDGIVGKRSVQAWIQRCRRTRFIGGRPVTRRLGDGQLQGNPVGAYAAWPASQDQGRHLWRPKMEWPCLQHRRRDRRQVQSAATRKCNRKLSQGITTHSCA